MYNKLEQTRQEYNSIKASYYTSYSTFTRPLYNHTQLADHLKNVYKI